MFHDDCYGAYTTKAMEYNIDVPFKVVISEAVALARKFGATDGHKYINGVLDQAAAQSRVCAHRPR